MAVFRVEKTRDYTVMANHHLKNRNLTLKAKGLPIDSAVYTVEELRAELNRLKGVSVC